MWPRTPHLSHPFRIATRVRPLESSIGCKPATTLHSCHSTPSFTFPHPSHHIPFIPTSTLPSPAPSTFHLHQPIPHSPIPPNPPFIPPCPPNQPSHSPNVGPQRRSDLGLSPQMVGQGAWIIRCRCQPNRTSQGKPVDNAALGMVIDQAKVGVPVGVTTPTGGGSFAQC